MTRVAVTGGTGFIGANLVRRLLDLGHEVHLLNRPGFAEWRIAEIAAKLHLHQLDLADLAAVQAVIASVRPRWVFHLAAHGAYSWQADLSAMLATNYAGTVALVQACERAGVECLVNVGSSSEYGLQSRPAREDDAPQPNSDYAATKAAATLFCQSRARRGSLHIPTLRLYSIYGPWEEPARLMPQLISRGLDGAWPPLVHPLIARDLVHVDDAVEALLRAATKPPEEAGAIINIASGRQRSLADIVATVAEIFAISAEPNWGGMAPRAWDTDVWCGDTAKATALLGWQAQRELRDGIAGFAAWMQAEPARRARYRLVAPVRNTTR